MKQTFKRNYTKRSNDDSEVMKSEGVQVSVCVCLSLCDICLSFIWIYRPKSFSPKEIWDLKTIWQSFFSHDVMTKTSHCLSCLMRESFLNQTHFLKSKLRKMFCWSFVLLVRQTNFFQKQHRCYLGNENFSTKFMCTTYIEVNKNLIYINLKKQSL